MSAYEPTPLQLAEHNLAEAREALLHVEHGVDDVAVLESYVAALEARNAARLADPEKAS